MLPQLNIYWFTIPKKQKTLNKCSHYKLVLALFLLFIPWKLCFKFHLDDAQYGFIQLSVLFSPCLGSCDIFYFWNARIYKVDVFVYLWWRTESPLGDADKKLNVGDENKHTLLCIVPLCSHITRTVCWELASCLVRMWTGVWSIPQLARRLADVFSPPPKKKSHSGASLFSLNCTFASHGVGYFSAFDVQNGGRLQAAWRSVRPAHLPASCGSAEEC